MPSYRWADLRLSTNFDLPELSLDKADAAADEWRVDRWEGRVPSGGRRQWFHRWRQPNGRRWLSFARHQDGYLLRFNGLADFDARPGRRQIDGYRAATTPAHTFNHLLLDQALPLVCGGADRLALHASVVEVDNGAVAFLGGAGYGKSTLAAAFARRGHRVLSDDCCVIRRAPTGFEVLSTYPGLRLFPEAITSLFGSAERSLADVSHYSTKQRIVPDSGKTDTRLLSVPLRCLYTLARHDRTSTADANQLRVARRSRREAVLDLVGGTFYLDVSDARGAREGFELAAAAASSCHVRLLTVPWNLAALDTAVSAILDDLQTRG